MALATALSFERLGLIFGPCCLLLFSLRAKLVLVVSHLLARLCVRLLEGSVQSCFFLWLKLHFLGFTVLPWSATVLPQGTVLPQPARQ